MPKTWRPASWFPNRGWFAWLVVGGITLLGCGDDGGGDNDNGNENGNDNGTVLCGDGVVEGTEECDEGAANSDSTPDACRTDCREPFCGDGVSDSGEACDDGPSNSDVVPDACRSDCREPTCGDGVVDVAGGERCDCGDDPADLPPGCGGINGADFGGCRADCRVSYCGNSTLDGSEVCDDGNFVSGDGCSADCLSDETCGNGYVDTIAGEECDDGNTDPADQCQPDCRFPRCGDGVLDAGEECDDANRNSGDGCQASCLLPQCGDGILDAGEGETCDDGNLEPGDGCNADCLREICGNGVLDASEICDDGNNVSGDGCNAGCTSTEVCGNGIVDLENPAGAEQCDDGNTDDGDGCSAQCWIEACGNGHHEPIIGEVCDDGNNVSGDGCSAACNSLEVCGNGVVDLESPTGGEQCDDGNALSHDGCSSGCTAEFPIWNVFEDGLPAVSGFGLAYDAARQRVVAFGGEGECGPLCANTWEYDGERWREVHPPHSPAGRRLHAMAHDSHRQQVVLYGGEALALFGDTWRYDGTDWSPLAPANSPPGRSGAVMVYDGQRQVFVLFGGKDGRNGGRYLDETWEYDPAANAWSQINPVVSPPARDQPGLAYDAGRGVVVLLGGDGGGGTECQEHWEYDASVPTWTLISVAAGPLCRGEHAVAYDPDRGVTVLHAGWGNCPGSPCQDTWELQGATGTWTQVSTATSPPRRYQGRMVYDSHQQRMILVGGEDLLGTPLDDTWAYAGGDWASLTARMRPGGRENAAMVYDDARGELILFGGIAAGNTLHEPRTYHRGADGWRSYPCPGTPGTDCPQARGSHGMAWDPVREVAVLFGGLIDDGSGSAIPTDDTWEYDPATRQWTLISTGAGPAPRAYFGMIYDTAAQRVVLFGGAAGDNPGAGVYADTWEYDGATGTWTEITPTGGAPSPPARGFLQMTFDGSSLTAVLFSGVDDNLNVLTDTWSLSGGQWTELTPAVSPPPRGEGMLVFDPLRSRTMLFGGIDLAGFYSDLWEWDGQTWSQVSANNPAPRAYMAAAWDQRAGGIRMVGGASTRLFDDEYLLRYTSAWPDEQCDNGVDDDGDTAVDCADPDCEGKPCTAGGICEGGVCQAP